MDLRISTVSHFSSWEIALQFKPSIKTTTVLPPPTLQSRLKSNEKINVILSSGMLVHLLHSDFDKNGNSSIQRLLELTLDSFYKAMVYTIDMTIIHFS